MDNFCNQSWCLDYPDFPDFPDEPYWPDEEFEHEFWDEEANKASPEHTLGPTPHIIKVFDICTLCVANGSVLTNGCILVIYLLLMKKNQRKIPNLMLVNQALADIFLSVYAILTVVPSYMKSLFVNFTYRTVVMVMGYYSVFLSLGVLLLTSAERYLALKKPFFHRRFISKTKMRLGILLVYVTAFSPCVVYLSYLKHGNINEETHKNFYAIFGGVRVSFVFLGVMVVIVLLFFSYRTVDTAIKYRRTGLSSLALTVYRPDGEGRERNRLSLLLERQKEKKMTTIFVTMAVVFFFSYIPLAIFSTIRAISSFSIGHEELLAIELIGHLLYILSAFINPLLTLTLKDDYRKQLSQCLSRTREQKVEQRTELLTFHSLNVSTNGL